MTTRDATRVEVPAPLARLWAQLNPLQRRLLMDALWALDNTLDDRARQDSAAANALPTPFDHDGWARFMELHGRARALMDAGDHLRAVAEALGAEQ